MLQSATLGQAKKYFSLGRVIRVFPCDRDGRVTDEDQERSLLVYKHNFCYRWPEERVNDFRVMTTIREKPRLAYYVETVTVLARRMGAGHFLLQEMDGRRSWNYFGSDRGLVRFLRNQALHLANAGYLEYEAQLLLRADQRTTEVSLVGR